MALSQNPLPIRLGIIQNTSNSTSDKVTVSTESNATTGIILNPPSTAGQGGGSLPIASPSPDEALDISQLFVTGAGASDQVSVYYV